MKITLKDGSVKEYAQPMSILDIAKDLSEGLARAACAGVVDGETEDLRTVLDKDCSLNICTVSDPEGLAALRHTASHVMAQAIKRLYPDVKLAIGPSIADGFYYDIDSEDPVTAEDLEKIENEMKKIVKEALPLERFTLPRAEAIAFMEEKKEPYKVELIQDLPEDAEISFYRQGEFTDLCAGPHLMSTKEVGKAFKLTSIAGAYWRGNEHNKMLTRIYGTAFGKKADLEAYITMMEEAKKRGFKQIYDYEDRHFDFEKEPMGKYMAKTSEELLKLLEEEYDYSILAQFRNKYITVNTNNCTRQLSKSILELMKNEYEKRVKEEHNTDSKEKLNV